MDYPDKDIARFWGKVDKENSQTFYDGTRCWEWIAAAFHVGYGKIHWGSGPRLAHRVSYEFVYGEIPNGLLVLHHCDNRLCVNPAHLFLGTNQDNIDDMVRKGRQARGENGKHKLTDVQVSEIRRRYAWFGIGGDNSYELGKEFNVSNNQIIKIVKRLQRR